MHALTRSTKTTEPALLAKLDPFRPGSLETCLIYPADAPADTFSRFKRLLLTPLMQLEARQQVQRFLAKDGIHSLPSAQALANRLAGHIFRTVKASELSAVLAEATLNKVPLPGTLRPLTAAYFHDPDHLDSACQRWLGDWDPRHAKALNALITFARHPDAPLNRRDTHGIRNLLKTLDPLDLPADVAEALTDYSEKYFAAFDETVRIGAGFADSNDGKALMLAFDELYARLPEQQTPWVAALERFSMHGKATPQDLPLLQQALPQLAHHSTKLGPDTVKPLLSVLIAAEDTINGKSLVNAINPAEHLTSEENMLAISLLSAVRHHQSSYSPTAAMALIEYLTLTSRIRQLEAEIQSANSLLAAATQNKAAKFEQQKLAALKKRRLPGKSQKKATLAYQGVWRASTAKLPTLRAELASLKARLINPESRLRLAYVALHRDQLMQCLPSVGKKTKRLAEQVLRGLSENLDRTRAEGGM